MSASKTDTSAWSFRNFRLFTFSGVLMPYAAQTQSLLIGWQVYEIQKDPLYLGFIGLTEAVPALSLALVTGYIADRANPLNIFKNLVRLDILSTLLLLFISFPGSGISPEQKLPILYLVAFMSGINRGFRMPARTALVPRLVPREALHVSAAWSTLGFATASSLGPAVGGFLYGWMGPLLPFGFNLILQVTALVLLSQIRIEWTKHTIKESISTFDNLTAGLKYVFSHQLLLAALALDMFAVLFGGAVALLPIFAGEILHVGPSGLGVLRAATSVGALAGSFFLVRYPISKNAGPILLGSVVAYGLCMIGFGVSKIFAVSVICLALGGLFDSVSMVIRGAIVQLSAPPEMRGRIGAVNSMFIGVSNQLGEFESGVAAKLMGAATSVVFGGVVTLAVVVVTAVKAPKFRKMELSSL